MPDGYGGGKWFVEARSLLLCLVRPPVQPLAKTSRSLGGPAVLVRHASDRLWQDNGPCSLLSMLASVGPCVSSAGGSCKAHSVRGCSAGIPFAPLYRLPCLDYSSFRERLLCRNPFCSGAHLPVDDR